MLYKTKIVKKNNKLKKKDVILQQSRKSFKTDNGK